MSDELFFIDTSVPIYAAGGPGEHKESCVRILERIEAREINAAIDTEVIQEILYRFHRINMEKKGLELSQNILRLGLRMLPVLKRNIEDTMILFEKYTSAKVPPRDILHTAVMLDNGICNVITVDKHFGDVIKEVKRVEPGSFLP